MTELFGRAGEQSGVRLAEAEAQPVAVPVPPTAVPVQIADEEVAVRVAVYGSPEEGRLALVFLREEVWIGEVEVEELGSYHGFAFEVVLEVGTDDGFALLLLLGQIGLDGLRVKLPLACKPTLNLVRGSDFPARRSVGCGVEVDNVSKHFLN